MPGRFKSSKGASGWSGESEEQGNSKGSVVKDGRALQAIMKPLFFT
jgi:hypothetical protein